MARHALLPFLAWTLAAAPSAAQTPLGTAFTYQGRLVDAGTPADGAFDFQLALFDAPAGGSQVGPTVTAADAAVAQGLFTVSLDFGAVFGGNRRWLEIGVRPGASTGAYTVLSPRQELTAGPGALFSTTAPWVGVTNKPPGFADDVDNDTTYSAGAGIAIAGTIVSVATNGVTSGMIAADTIVAADIAAGAVGSAELAANAVNTTHVASDTLTAADLGVASVGSSEIADGSVATADLADSSVTVAKIAADAVTSSEIATDAVGAAEIATAAVGSAEIAAGAVNTSELATGAVTTAILATNSVTALAIATDAVGTAEIAANAVTRSEISGTELGIYLANNPGCGLPPGPIFNATCTTLPCGPLFLNCAGVCNQSSAQVCNNLLVGYLLSPTIP